MANHKNLIILHEEENFELKGIVVLPRHNIKSLRDNKYDKCGNSILRHNGQINFLSRSRWIRQLKSIRQTIEELHKRRIWPGIETVTGNDSAYFLGPIVDTTQRSFNLHCYDAAGQWEDIYKITYKEVFAIEFWNAYTRHFNEYMRGTKRCSRLNISKGKER